MSERRDLNEYLAAEWGLDHEQAGDDRPFALTPVGEIGEQTVYAFQDADGAYYAFGAPYLRFMPASGMTLEDLRVQELGSDWIAERDPIDPGTSRIGDPRVPSAIERRAAIDRLAAGSRVVEGLFLIEEQRSVVLVQPPGDEDRLILEGEPAVAVPRVDASPVRRMSHAAGFRLLR